MRRLFILIACCLVMATWLPRAATAEEGEPAKAATKASHKKKGKKAKGKKAAQAATRGKKGSAGKMAATRAGKATAKPFRGGGGTASAGTAIVTEIRHWSTPDYSRIAVTLDRDAKFEYHHLPPSSDTEAPRLYIDISGARLAPGVKDFPIGDGLLKTARVAQYRADTVRVVLDLESLGDCKVVAFSDPFRIIVDIKGVRREEISRPREAELAPLPAPAPAAVVAPAEEKPKAAARVASAKIRRIVVDPGHGGHDPGAIGAGGTKEKDVVLQIGLRLAAKLREELGVDVVMTRSTDVFLELQERTALANQVGADLFVSVHANAALNRATSGIETYYLNLAKTEKVAQLAAKENGTTLEKVSLLQAVLFDLMANYKLNDSARLADEVQKAVHHRVSGRYDGVKNLGVKQGPFYVLVGATMPSILVETSFVSNGREEERLKDPVYQELIARGILDGIRGYVETLK
jgi:N-acetylmuramoyl-L-alanine amidase